MRKRICALRAKSTVAIAVVLVVFVLVGCGANESSVSGDLNGGTTPTSGGEAPVDLTTIDLKAAVAAQMGEATAEGMYGCCLKMPCTQCMVNMGECPCGENIQVGNPVCHECKGGWDAGGGSIEGVSAEDVNVMSRGGM